MVIVSNTSSTESLSDEQLVALVVQGNGDAFAKLVSRCTPMIQQQAAKLRVSWLDTEDLAQEGLLGLYSAAQSYRENKNAKFRTYAYVCIRHRMLSAVQKAAGDHANVVADIHELADDASYALIGQASPESLLVERDENARLMQRIQKLLSDMEYQVLMLHLGAFRYDEIAYRLNISTKAVDNALQRIRRKLSRLDWRDAV